MCIGMCCYLETEMLASCDQGFKGRLTRFVTYYSNDVQLKDACMFNNSDDMTLISSLYRRAGLSTPFAIVLVRA